MNQKLYRTWLRVLVILLALHCEVAGVFAQNLQSKARPSHPARVGQRQLPAVSRLRVHPFDGTAHRQSPFKASQSASQNVSTTDAVQIYGLMVYDLSWTSYAYGIYQYPAAADIDFTAIKTGRNMVANGGGVAVGDDYYCMYYENNGAEGYVNTLFHYDTNTWNLEETKTVSMGCAATDLTYDPTTGNVYGVFLSDDYSSFVFGRVDFSTGLRTVIAALSQSYSTISANAEGEIYGIGEDGVLYQFDKLTGTATRIGSTGYVPDTYNQSATFDMATGTLYWSANMDDGTCGLYTVDTSTGAATLVGLFPNSNEIIGTYIPAALTDDGAPAAVTDLAATFAGGQTTGSVSFTSPTTTFGGDALSGQLTYTIYVNDAVVATGTVNAGERLVKDGITAKTGQTTVKVSVSNGVGTSPYATIALYIGHDTPKAVTDLTLKKVGEKAQLSWTASEGGENGGYVDPSAITYSVVRQPDGATVATGLSATALEDEPSSAQMQSYYYEVTPHFGSLSGQIAESNHVIFGDGSDIPYSQTFDDANSFDLLTIIDGYDDGCTWAFHEGSQTAECAYSTWRDKDEWLITPPLRLKNDRQYTLSYTANSLDLYQPDTLEVRLGQSPTVEALQTIIAEKQLIGYSAEGATAYKYTFTVPFGGNWWFFLSEISYSLNISVLCFISPSWRTPRGTKTGQNHRKINIRALCLVCPCGLSLFQPQRYDFYLRIGHGFLNFFTLDIAICLSSKQITQVPVSTDLCVLSEKGGVKICFMPFGRLWSNLPHRAMSTVQSTYHTICHFPSRYARRLSSVGGIILLAMCHIICHTSVQNKRFTTANAIQFYKHKVF